MSLLAHQAHIPPRSTTTSVPGLAKGLRDPRSIITCVSFVVLSLSIGTGFVLLSLAFLEILGAGA